MKNEKKIATLADTIWKLERECQSDNNVSENLAEMEKILSDLSPEDLISVILYLESNHH